MISQDSEEIAEIAVRILSSYFSMNMALRKVQLLDMQPEVVAFCEDFLGFLASVPELAAKHTMAELDVSPALLPTHLRENPPAIDANQKQF